MPRPRIHLIRFHGLFAPHAKNRKLIVPAPGEVLPGDSDKLKISKYRISWAKLLKRVFDIDTETCQKCAGKMKIVAAVVSPYLIKKILQHLKLPHELPIIAASRGPPKTLNDFEDLEFNQQTTFDD